MNKHSERVKYCSTLQEKFQKISAWPCKILYINFKGNDKSTLDCRLYGKGCIHVLVAHQVRASPSLSSMKRVGVFLLLRGLDTCPSQGYPQH